MKVLVSWSGDRSRGAAEALAPWLRKAIGCEPWLSTQDIHGGEWTPQLQYAIAQCDACIACLTPENLSSEWLHFETGAVAARAERNLILPWCIDVTPAKVRLPLSRFQVYTTSRADTKQMLMSLLRYREQSGQDHAPEIDRLMDIHFPALDAQLSAVRESCGPGMAMLYRTQSEPGFKYDSLIDPQTGTVIVVGQNLQGLVRGGFFNILRDCFIGHSGFEALIILAPLEFFYALTSSRKQKQIYREQYKSTVRELKLLRDSIGDTVKERLRIYAHPGACSLSAIFCDPNDPRRGRLAFTAKWATDELPGNRISSVIRRMDNEILFLALYGYIGIMDDKTHSLALDQLLDQFRD